MPKYIHVGIYILTYSSESTDICIRIYVYMYLNILNPSKTIVEIEFCDAGVDFGGFLCRVQVARWVPMVCMQTKLLHRRTGVLARVYVHFGGEGGVQ